MQPKGSFKNKSGEWWVACMECTRGINGNQDCSNGVLAKNLKSGCYSGQLLEIFKEGGAL
ncbi:hypothetical protein [Natronincola ferrireducens]|nr:hypothetical protein [Natronincola ferrireducens]